MRFKAKEKLVAKVALRFYFCKTSIAEVALHLMQLKNGIAEVAQRFMQLKNQIALLALRFIAFKKFCAFLRCASVYSEKMPNSVFGSYAALDYNFKSFQIGGCKKATVSYHCFQYASAKYSRKVMIP